MASHLLDTHVLIWLGFSEHLGSKALGALATVQRTGGIAVSAISSWEIAQLQIRGRLELNAPAHRWASDVAAALDAEPLPIDLEIAGRSVNLPGDLHGDPADRILIATARRHRLTLVTRDRAILRYAALGYVDALAV